MDWDQIRLHVVTGKGGTGKTTVAATLALTLASGGQRVLLVEVEGRQGLAQLFDTAPLPYEERKMAVAAAGGDVYALAVEPEAAVLEYLDMYYRLGRASKALEKMGLRALNQGEIYFDNVEVPISHLLAGPDTYVDFVRHTLAEANVHVANMAVGIARAAYEHAHGYAHERKAGGQTIIHHQSVKYRIFHMFRKVEAARALVRRVATYNATAPEAALQGSICAKITATQTAFEVASDALQIFGGNGMTKEYPMEKLLRDARAMLIADG